MAAVDYFIKIDGIDGESTDAKHKNEIDVMWYAWDVEQKGGGVGAGLGAGKAKLADFELRTRVNKAGPKLMLACASGQHIKKAVLTARKAGKDQQDFMIITFSDLLISKFKSSGTTEEDHGREIVPTDYFALNFSKIEFAYKEQKADGSLGGEIKAGWNVKENKAV
jgi:type VI secretion system secreted protein Hcp